jgi:hypothetical protein
MVANAEKTVEYAFATTGSNIATNTALSTTTRWDFPFIGLTIPETTSRNFKSVILECYYRDAFTTVYNTSGWRLGITCGSNAASDVDYTPTAQGNTGDHETNCVIRDVTDYFNANFGTSASQSCQASLAISTATAANVENLTAKLYITYEYEASGSRSVKTVRIPIQSGSSPLAIVSRELGTGGTSAAPANQVPALNTFLPESNKTYLSTWFEMFGNDSGAATTDFWAFYQINDQTSASRCYLEQALNTGTFFHDIWLTKYTDGSGVIIENYPISASAASAFKTYSSLAARFDAFGGLYYVTYEYDSTSASVINSVILPFDTDSSNIMGTSASNANVVAKDFWVTEPNVALAQSGLLLYVQSAGGATLNIGAGSQTVRPYTLTALVNSGGHSLVHRIDHNSGATLARGKNTISVKAYTSAATGAANTLTGYIFLNYTSNSAAGGESCHNHTTIWHNATQFTTGAAATENDILTTNQRTPSILSPDYWLNGVGYEINSRFGVASNLIYLFADKLTGEYNGDGWETLCSWYHTNDGELASYREIEDATDRFNIDGKRSREKMDIEVARPYRLAYSTAALFSMKTYLTYHTNTFAVSGSFLNPASLGADVKVDAYRTYDNMWSGSTLSTASGSYIINVLDNVYPYFVSASQDTTHIGRSASAIAV